MSGGAGRVQSGPVVVSGSTVQLQMHGRSGHGSPSRVDNGPQVSGKWVKGRQGIGCGGSAIGSVWWVTPAWTGPRIEAERRRAPTAVVTWERMRFGAVDDA